MENTKAMTDFCKAADAGDYAAACEALKFIPREVVNERDGDDYDMLITAVQNGSVTAVRALLASGKCDLEHRENLCGMTAREFAQDYPAGSPMRRAFEEVPENPTGKGGER